MSTQRRVNEFRQGLTWLQEHQTLPALLASIYAACVARGGVLWFDGPMAPRWTQLFPSSCEWWQGDGTGSPGDVYVDCDLTNHERVPGQMTSLAFYGRKEVWERRAWARQVKTPVFIDTDSPAGVELAAHGLQLLVADVLNRD